MSLRKKAPILLLGLVIAAAYLGVKYRLPFMANLLVTAIALFGVGSGFQMIIRRRATVPKSIGSSAHKEYYTGFAAQITGALYVIGGLILAVLALAPWFLPNSAYSFRQFLNGRFGIGSLLMLGGLMILMFGVTRLIATRTAFSETRLPTVDRYVGGVYFSLMGVALIALGLLHIVAPGVLTSIIESVKAVVSRFVN